jgi:hypothetical protein
MLCHQVRVEDACSRALMSFFCVFSAFATKPSLFMHCRLTHYSAIKYALKMPAAERREYHRYAFRHMRANTAQHWAVSFIDRVSNPTQVSSRVFSPLPSFCIIALPS